MDHENKSISLLLIEDNPADANYLRALLAENRRVDIRITRASRVSEGLELIKKGGFDVVLSDLHLPDCSGMETLQRVRQADPNLPIIMLTGLDDDSFAVAAVQAGVQDYLVKADVDAGIVVRAIRYAIERKKLENAHYHAVEELGLLRGLLPVCPVCRRERELGLFRKRLDEYLDRLPPDDLTGSFCPECLGRSGIETKQTMEGTEK